MNIKRTFFALAAALLLPGLALAGTTTFVAFIDFADDNEWDSVFVTNSCNGGLPLVSPPSEASDGEKITFVLTLSNEGPNTADCDITIDGLANYTAVYQADGGFDVNLDDQGNPSVAETGCFFTDVAPNGEGGAQLACHIVLNPNPGIMTVHKEWETFGQFTNEADLNLSATIRACADDSGIVVGSSQLNSPTRYCSSLTVFGTDTEWVDFTINTLHDPGNDIWIEEVNNDSVVETDLSDCAGDFNFQPGDDHECTIVNTVFFEGIPTLNQYGLAIMALLMLGVGFVGFRRFV